MEGVPPDDGFKWFGEGFEGFPKRLPDDCVEYVIHVIGPELTTPSAVFGRLNQINKETQALTRKLLSEYIWQRDDFQLRVHPQPGASTNETVETSNLPFSLRGRTNFGDSMTDEWLVVYLLFELSKNFPEAWIRVYDTDGEFLLIEAAKALPKWLNPDIATNRVWINNGHLRLIPLDEADESGNRNISLEDALAFAKASPERFIINPFIEDAAFARLKDYPSAIAQSLHHSRVIIPRKLAYLLHRNPSYISPAIEAFYLRDPVALKPLATKDISTLQFSPEDFVTVSVKFTKVGFAQLRSQIFPPPPAWTAVAPRVDDQKVDVGMKIACGMEMLLADSLNASKKVVREMSMLLEDLESGEEKLPSDMEIKGWGSREDDEKWLDIDYADFENELAGDKGKTADDNGDANDPAQAHLRKVVKRFEEFLDDDQAGMDGVGSDADSDGDEDDDEDDSSSISGEDKEQSYDEVEFERAMREMMGMPTEEIERNGLLDEARQLALDDEDESNPSTSKGKSKVNFFDDDGATVPKDKDLDRVMELLQKELRSRGALDADGNHIPRDRRQKPDGTTQPSSRTTTRPFFGPERPPHMQSKSKIDAGEEEADEEIGPGDLELSSDEEDFDGLKSYNDFDVDLAKNLLSSYKGQAGAQGPAGNMMKALGLGGLPQDEDMS